MTALGSGIYSPSGPLNYTYNTTGGSELVIAQIPILTANDLKNRERRGQEEEVVEEDELADEELVEEEMVKVEGGRSQYNFENMTGYSRVALLAGQDEVRLCHNEIFCCEAAYSLVGDLGDSQPSYHLVAYQGLRAMAIPAAHL